MNLERVTPLVWTLLWLIIGCQSIGAFAEGGREVALTGGGDQKNMSQELVVKKRATSSCFNSCYKGMADVGVRYYNRHVMRDNWLRKDIVCDTVTDRGGWILIQRRTTGDVDFYRNWAAYKHGFGTPSSDFWLGNEAIYKLTNKDAYELRIDFTDYKRGYLFAVYESFKLESEADNYRLRIGLSSGGTLPGRQARWYGLNWQKNIQFGTYDRYQYHWAGPNLAHEFHGAWWFRGVKARSYLNGRWGDKSRAWWIGPHTWLFANRTEMKIRRKKDGRFV